MNDLELCSIDDLAGELKKRFKDVVIAGRGARLKSKGSFTFTDFEGDWTMCAGLCELVKLTIMEDYKEKVPNEIKTEDI